MKKRTALLGAFLCTIIMGSMSYADPAYTVTTSMNFRAAPSITGLSIGSVPMGSSVSYITSQDGWDYISFNGATGWIHGGNITAGTLPAVSQTANTQTYNTNTSGTSGASSQTASVLYSMNFRSAPGMYGTIMNTVPAGSQVQYIGSENGWDHIVFNGNYGWIAGGRLSRQTSSSGTYSTANTQASAGTYNAYASGSGNTVANAMNFRASAGLNGSVMGIIPVGSSVSYLYSSNGWDKVSFQGMTGWIKSGNLY